MGEEFPVSGFQFQADARLRRNGPAVGFTGMIFTAKRVKILRKPWKKREFFAFFGEFLTEKPLECNRHPGRIRTGNG